MQEYLFRGKADSGEWVYGYYYRCKDMFGKTHHVIRPKDMRAEENYYAEITGGIEVDPETVGQFCEMYAHDGVQVFEGDILGAIPRKIGRAPTVIVVITDVRNCKHIALDVSNYFLIGNVHDNKDLLKAIESGETASFMISPKMRCDLKEGANDGKENND